MPARLDWTCETPALCGSQLGIGLCVALVKFRPALMDFAAVHADRRRRRDADSDSAGLNLQNRKLDVVIYDDLFTDFASEDQHGCVLHEMKD
jgi:hypothetical protein